MKQRISDDQITMTLAGRDLDITEALALDLRDARKELAALDKERPRILHGLARYQAALTIAVEALEYYKDDWKFGMDAHINNKKAVEALDRIKKIG